MAGFPDDQPGIGEHASDPPEVDPGEGRRGVGNVSKEDFDADREDESNPLSQGAQGLHARTVGEVMGVSPEPRPNQR
jgi:hypothetical protein